MKKFLLLLLLAISSVPGFAQDYGRYGRYTSEGGGYTYYHFPTWTRYGGPGYVSPFNSPQYGRVGGSGGMEYLYRSAQDSYRREAEAARITRDNNYRNPPRYR